LRSLEALYADRQEEQVEALAYHALRGELWAEALRYSQRAGAKAVARSAFNEAVIAFEQALESHGHLPLAEADVRTAVDLHLAMHGAYMPLGKINNLMRHMDLAEAGAQSIGDEETLARIYALRGYYLFFSGDFRKAVPPATAATQHAARSSSLAAKITANYYLGIARYASGDHRGALPPLLEAIGLIPPERWYERFDSAGVPAAVGRLVAAASYAAVGEFPEAVRLGQEGIAISERADIVLNSAVSYWLYSNVLARKGDFPAALEVADKGLMVAAQGPGRLSFSQLAASAGEAHLRLGRPEAAVALLEQAIEAKTFARGYKIVTPFVMLGETYVELNAVNDAHQLATAALLKCDTSGDLPSKVWTLRLFGLIALTGRQISGGNAAEWFQRGIDLAQQLELRPVRAHCHLGLAQALRQAGRAEESAGQFAVALSEYQAMDMAHWAERVLAIQAEG
jgi:tetratricopeptide (TPR) repeat protein